MSDDEMKAELERLRNENAAIKKGVVFWYPHESKRKGRSFDLRHRAFL